MSTIATAPPPTAPTLNPEFYTLKPPTPFLNPPEAFRAPVLGTLARGWPPPPRPLLFRGVLMCLGPGGCRGHCAQCVTSEAQTLSCPRPESPSAVAPQAPDLDISEPGAGPHFHRPAPCLSVGSLLGAPQGWPPDRIPGFGAIYTLRTRTCQMRSQGLARSTCVVLAVALAVSR